MSEEFELHIQISCSLSFMVKLNPLNEFIFLIDLSEEEYSASNNFILRVFVLVPHLNQTFIISIGRQSNSLLNLTINIHPSNSGISLHLYALQFFLVQTLLSLSHMDPFCYCDISLTQRSLHLDRDERYSV